MKFYQVKREADNKKLDKNWNILVGGELFTEKEMEKYGRRWADRNNYDRNCEMAYTKRQRELFWKILLNEKSRKIRPIGYLVRVFRLKNTKWRLKP